MRGGSLGPRGIPDSKNRHRPRAANPWAEQDSSRRRIPQRRRFPVRSATTKLQVVFDSASRWLANWGHHARWSPDSAPNDCLPHRSDSSAITLFSNSTRVARAGNHPRRGRRRANSHLASRYFSSALHESVPRRGWESFGRVGFSARLEWCIGRDSADGFPPTMLEQPRQSRLREA